VDDISGLGVLIVGGGVGGMTLATQLSNQGVPCTLAEIDPGWKAVGAGLTLNGASLRAFEELGVLDQVRSAGHIHGGRKIHDIHGNVLREQAAYVPAADDMSAGGGILRPTLHRILSSATRASGATVRLGVTVDALSDTGGGVDVQFSDGTQGRFGLVVGADGLMSKVRRLAFPEAPAPVFTGQGCWRALFPKPRDVQTIWVFMDEGHKIGLNPISGDQMYMFLLESAPGNPWREPADWPELLRERMAPFGGLIGELRERVDHTTSVNYRPLESLLMSPPWHQGRIVLLGDACHATTPHAGYGAGLAVEDALCLARRLAEAGELGSRLERFTNERYPRCRAVLQGSLKVGELEMAQASVDTQLAASADLATVVREYA